MQATRHVKDSPELARVIVSVPATYRAVNVTVGVPITSVDTAVGCMTRVLAATEKLCLTTVIVLTEPDQVASGRAVASAFPANWASPMPSGPMVTEGALFQVISGRRKRRRLELVEARISVRISITTCRGD